MDDEWDTFGGMDDHPGSIDNSALLNGVYFHLYYPIFGFWLHGTDCCTSDEF
jgi:hypothetical protein